MREFRFPKAVKPFDGVPQEPLPLKAANQTSSRWTVVPVVPVVAVPEKPIEELC
jgi:hypothetical protein